MPSAGITFTLDLEDHRPNESSEFRVPAVTRRVLGSFEHLRVTGTVFAVGEVAEQVPELVRDIAAAGHELALHAWRHTPLPELSPEQFRQETAKGKALLEDLVQQPVSGYRAPIFSLTPASAWAVEILAELGFTYSSSILPGRYPLYGWPGAPRGPFRWPSGLLELPAPVVQVGPYVIPYLGGIHVRLLPLPVIRRLLAREPDDAFLWLYCHPYDFDPDEEYWVVPPTGPWTSRLLWLKRRGFLAKTGRLFEAGSAAPLRDRLADLAAGRTFTPARSGS
jgi:polysaccharide deacetylase family protein (PEP-CTERM system associated)